MSRKPPTYTKAQREANQRKREAVARLFQKAGINRDKTRLTCPDHDTLLRNTDGKCVMFNHYPHGLLKPKTYETRLSKAQAKVGQA